MTSHNLDIELLHNTIVKNVNSHVKDYISHQQIKIQYTLDEQIQWIFDKSNNEVFNDSTANPTEMTSITKINHYKKPQQKRWTKFVAKQNK